MKKHIFFLILFFSTIFITKADEPIKFEASAPTQVILDQPFQIVYSLNASGKDFRLPEITDFDLLAGPFTSRSSSTRIINGERTSSTSYTYTYTFLPKRTGTFTIPSATITIKREKHTSNGLTIEVLPPDAPVTPDDSRGNTQNNGNASDGSISNENLFMRTLVSKINVYEQEAILLTYRLYSYNLDVVNYSVKQFPDFKGFMKNDLENRQPQMNLENYKGRNYTVVDLYQTILFPQHTGELSIDKADFEFILRIQNPNVGRSLFDSFFDSYTNVSRNISAPAVKIKVNELPSSNKPMAFNGTVGTFKMTSSISAEEIKANEAVTIKIDIEGSGNMRMVKTPVLKLPDSFETYDPKVNNNFNATTSGVNGSKTIEYLFIPRHSGEFDIPPVEFCYFDTQSKSYKTLRTPNYHLNVLKAEDGTATAPTVIENYTGKEVVKQLGSDIRYIHTGNIELSEQKPMLVGTVTSWLMFLIPLLIALIIFIYLSKQAKENANIHMVKNKKANKIAQKRLKLANKLLKDGKKDQFYDEVLKAVWTYLSDKLSIPMATLTKDKVMSELTARGIDEGLISRLTDILNTGEFARYAPNSGTQEMGNLYEETINVISELEEKIKK